MNMLRLREGDQMIPLTHHERRKLHQALKPGVAPGLRTGQLHPPWAQSWPRALHYCPRLETEEPPDSLLKCLVEPAGNHTSRKIILTGSKKPGIGQGICLTCRWRHARKMRREIFFLPSEFSSLKLTGQIFLGLGSARSSASHTEIPVLQKWSTLKTVKLTHLFD